MPTIIEKVKKSAIGVATAAIFSGGVWVGNVTAPNDLYINAIEDAKVKTCFTDNIRMPEQIMRDSVVDDSTVVRVSTGKMSDTSVVPVIPRDLQDPMHLPKGDTAFIRIYYGNKFAREYKYFASDLLHDKYGLVQLVVDIDVQSDAESIDAE